MYVQMKRRSAPKSEDKMAKGPIPKKVGEEWRLIEGETDFYVSNFGRVRKNNRLINQSINQDGYYSCWIGSGDSRKRKLVHRLVAQAFIPNPENKEAVDHIDGNKLNNRFSDDPDINNLRWVTNQENTQAAYEKGLIQRTEVVAIDPYDYVFLYRTQAEAAKGAGTDAKTVNQVIKGLIKSAKGWRFFRMKGLEDKR